MIPSSNNIISSRKKYPCKEAEVIYAINMPNDLRRVFLFIVIILSFYNVNAQAYFDLDKTTILAGDTIEFTSTLNAGAVYDWTFPGGVPSTSSLKTNKVVYLYPDTYSVNYTNFGVLFVLSGTYASCSTSIIVKDGSIGNNNAALVDLISPKMVDPGVYAIKVKLRNRGENIINTVTINWELNGILQPSILWTNPLDTINGLTPMDAIVTLDSTIITASSSIPLRVWTSYPNGMPDSQTSNDTINFILRSKLSGSYTVGGVNPDFQTIRDAVRGLKFDYGIDGPVIFNIRDGIYNENVSLNDIKGTSALNTVLFKSENNNPSLVTITYTPTSFYNSYTVNIRNSNYISFQDLSIYSAGTSMVPGQAIVIAESTSFLSVENCSLTTTSGAISGAGGPFSYPFPSISTTTHPNLHCAVFGKELTGSNFKFKKNQIKGGIVGLFLAGFSQSLLVDKIVVDSNSFSGITNYSSYLQHNFAPKFRYNSIKTSGLASYWVRGPVFTYCFGEMEITNNKVSAIGLSSNVDGMNLYYCNGSPAYAKVANNEIVVETGSGNLSSGSLQSFALGHHHSGRITYYHNSVNNNSEGRNPPGLGKNHNAGYFINTPGITPGENIFRNNIFSFTGQNGYAMYMFDTYSMNSDYNLLYSIVPGQLIRTGRMNSILDTTYGSITAYRISRPTQEKYSTNYRPAYTSKINLEPNVSDTACWLMNGMGTHTLITDDIQGNNRPVIALDGAPDLGAYQFTPTVVAPRATPIPAIPIAGQPQVFMYGEDTLSILEWDSLSAIPTTIDIQNYTDSVIGSYPAQLQLREFMNANMTPATPGLYSYKVKYFYRTPLSGNIMNEQNLVGAKHDGINWTPFSSSVTTLDTLHNKIQITSALTDNTFAFTGTDKYLPLRVKLITFDAKAQGKDVLLLWSTASETNNLGFEIQRSEDGLKFVSIDFVKGAGNTTDQMNYHFIDLAALDKTKSNTLYYRLKQIDLDEKITYSPIEIVHFEAKQIASITLSPNPSTGVFTINAYLLDAHTINLKIVDITGTTVWNQSFEPLSGENTIDAQPQLSNGIYILLLEQNGQTDTHKLVIQH
jgi:hypothetical protein